MTEPTIVELREALKQAQEYFNRIAMLDGQFSGAHDAANWAIEYAKKGLAAIQEMIPSCEDYDRLEQERDQLRTENMELREALKQAEGALATFVDAIRRVLK